MQRFFAFPLVRLLLIAGAFVGAAFALAPLQHAARMGLAAATWTALAVLVAIVLAVERFAARKGARDVGFDPTRALRDTVFGLGAGAAIFSAVISELAGARAYTIAGVHVSRELASAALWLIPAAAIEEVLLRGVIFRLIAEWSGTWIALGISAALFGLLHLFNPGATWFSTFAIAVEAGLLLGAAYIVTKNLWMPIALHFAWNYCEGPLYGTHLSGLTLHRPLFEAHVAGPVWLTGGSFGPEAGVPALLTCSVAAAALLIHAGRSGAIVPCPWFRSSKALVVATEAGSP